jgi:hypothetical protein
MRACVWVAHSPSINLAYCQQKKLAIRVYRLPHSLVVAFLNTRGRETLKSGVAVGLGSVGEGERVAMGNGVAVGEGVSVCLGVGGATVVEGVGDGVVLKDEVGDGVLVWLGVGGATVVEGVGDGVGLEDGVGDGVLVWLGVGGATVVEGVGDGVVVAVSNTAK